MSWRISGRLVTMPVPRGKLCRTRQLYLRIVLATHTNLGPLCFPKPSSCHLTAIPRLLFVVDL